MRLNVRCCCQPQKILGTLDVVGIEPPRPGQLLHYALLGDRRSMDGQALDVERLALPVAVFVDGQVLELAIKSEETPIETLRRIPSFIEARP